MTEEQRVTNAYISYITHHIKNALNLKGYDFSDFQKFAKDNMWSINEINKTVIYVNSNELVEFTTIFDAQNLNVTYNCEYL